MGILRQLRIPVAAVYLGALAVVVCLGLGFFLSASFFSDKVSQAELEQLRAENSQLVEKYDKLRWNLAEVESRYQDLVTKEISMRSLFDLPEINAEERQLGIGGPTSPMLAVLSEPMQSAIMTELEVDRLLRLSNYELVKYDEVEQELLSVKDRLSHTPSIWPTKGWRSRGYGMKYDPFTGFKQMHRGIDLANHTGTLVVATADGKVIRASKNGQMGKTIVIDHGYGFRTRYGHLSDYQVKRGQRVKRGDVIALMGSTGYSTGPHLHYEVIRNGKFYNPMKYILNKM